MAKKNTEKKNEENNEENVAEKETKRVSFKGIPMAGGILEVRLTFDQCVLGSLPDQKTILEQFICKNIPEGDDKKDKLDKLEEELDAIRDDENRMTVFPRDKEGNPCLYDYQIKGAIKNAFGVFTETQDIKLGSKAKISKWTHKRFADSFVKIYPRFVKLNIPKDVDCPDLIPTDADNQMHRCARPIRKESFKGGQVALVCSEAVPEGTTCEFKIEYLHPGLREVLIGALNYFRFMGIGQWRSSGKGSVRKIEIKENGQWSEVVVE